MSNTATSGSVIPAAPPDLAGETSKFHRLRFFLAFLRARPSFAVGYAVVTVVIVVALFAPWLAPYGPVTADPNVDLLPPGAGHVLGTDGTGMDIFSRVLFAPRVDLAIAIIGTLLSAVIGGANLMGGEGTAYGAFIGSALIFVIRNALLMAGVDSNWQGLFVGCFIILAVVLQVVRGKRRE